MLLSRLQIWVFVLILGKKKELSCRKNVSEYSLIGIFFSAPVGFSTNPGDCLFLPVPCEVKYLDAERSGCKFFFIEMLKKSGVELYVNVKILYFFSGYAFICQV